MKLLFAYAFLCDEKREQIHLGAEEIYSRSR